MPALPTSRSLRVLRSLDALHLYFYFFSLLSIAPFLYFSTLSFTPTPLTPCRSARRSHTFDSSVLLCLMLFPARAVVYRPFLTLPFSLVCFFLSFFLPVPLSFSSFRSVTFSLPLACSHFCCSPSRVPSAIKSAEAAPRFDRDRGRKKKRDGNEQWFVNSDPVHRTRTYDLPRIPG